MNARPVVFARVGWLEWYDARLDDKPPQRGGSYNVDNRGSEINNHRAIGEWCYGYVQTGSKTLGLNLKRLGARPAADEFAGVTIVEVATAPGGGQVVVGWFQNATCLAEYDDRPSRVYGSYNFWASQHDSVVVPLERRSIDVPKRRGALGQSNVCYADPDAKWVRQVMRAIGSYDYDDEPRPKQAKASRRRRGQGPLMDVAKRLEIERHAMERATRYFKQRGYSVLDVSRGDSIDLQCSRGRATMHVEVKGTQGTEREVALAFTKNEIDLANDRTKRTALFLVHGVEVVRTADGWRATGGASVCSLNWTPMKNKLVATQYRYAFDVKARK